MNEKAQKICAPDFGHLLYIGDVPVEASYHGSALLFRLMQLYPSYKLKIVEAGIAASLPERRLPEVSYVALPQPCSRALHTRFHPLVAGWYTCRARSRAALIDPLLSGFVPDAVLTVAHGYSWLTAAEYARRNQLPLHLIVHDDWPSLFRSALWTQAKVHEEFARVYREAESRLCISPYMEEEYERRYGVSGSVLYPSRSRDVAAYHSPSPNVLDTGCPLVYGFGGTINTSGHVQAILRLASAIEATGGRVFIYGPITPAAVIRAGMNRRNIELRGLVPADRFIERLRDEVNVLYLPMSFHSTDQCNMELLFPSKLTDYTAAGLPILVYGPETSSAARWARENEGVAEVVSAFGPPHLEDAVGRLHNPQHRMSLAANAIRAGARFFDHAAVADVFFSTLTLARRRA